MESEIKEITDASNQGDGKSAAMMCTEQKIRKY